MNADPSQSAAEAAGLSRRQLLGLLVAGIVMAGCEAHPSPPWDPGGIDPLPSKNGQIDNEPHHVHAGMEHSGDPQLQRLAGLEKELQYGFSRNMLVTGLPENREAAESQADDMAKTLQEYAKYGIKPLVLMAPTFDCGRTLANLAALNSAPNTEEYQTVLDMYFSRLYAAGITSEQMGTWALFPAPNHTGWQNNVTDPAIFKANFIPTAQALKTHFRDAKVTVMLDATTYRSGDPNPKHSSRDAAALLPYVTGIPDGLADSFALQGFPEQPLDSPAVYLNAGLAMACAAQLKVPEIWFNTGSLARIRTATGATVGAGPSVRATMLNDVVAEANRVIAAKQDYRVSSINLITRNEFPSGADWSYGTPEDRQALLSCIQSAAQSGIPVSLLN